MVLKTEQYLLGPEHPAFSDLVEMSNTAMRVRNQALYRMKKDLETQGKWSWMNTRKAMNKECEFYDSLPYKVASEIVRRANHDLKSYISLRKQGIFARKPGYGSHTGRTVLFFSGEHQVSKPGIRAGFIKVGGIKHELIRIPRCGKIREVRVIPRKHVFVIEVVHEVKNRVSPGTFGDGSVAGMDLGIDNLAALAINKPGVNPLLIDGRKVKSVNQRFHKATAKYQSELPIGVKYSSRLERISDNRNKAVKALLHSASREVVNYLIENQVSTLYVGWNEGLKTGNSVMGKKFNQRFRSIPWRVFVDMVTYKANNAGITVVEIEESYTSKTSCLDGELPIKHEIYAGQRVKRGLFRAGNGVLINADVNAAMQIVRKCKPDAFSFLRESQGVKAEVVPNLNGVLNPVRARVGGQPCAGKSAQKQANCVKSQ